MITGPRRIRAAPATMAAPVLAVIVMVVIVMAVTVGCSVPSRPAWWPKSGHSPQPAASRSGRKPAASPPAPPVPQVAKVWQQGMPQLGVNVYWQANTADDDSVIAAKARRIIDYVIGLDANSITLTFPFFTYGINSDTIYASSQTPSPADIAMFLSAAAASHVRVTVRPILNEDALVAQDPNAWRGSIEPGDVPVWFQSYQQLLVPYARVAAAGQAASFAVGSEFDSLQGDPQWPAVISAVQAVYPGQVVYDENYLDFTDHITDQPAGPPGIDAYPGFDLPDSAPVSELTSAWETWLSQGPRSVDLTQTVLSEVGIDAVPGSYDHPGAWVGISPALIDEAVQANWFQAVCQAVAADHLAGVYWWDVNFDADPANPAQADAQDPITFFGRAAQAQVKACFTQLSGAAG